MGAALCRCFGPKLPPGSSRVVRMLSGGVRARALFIWVDEVAERKRLLNKLRVAAAAMANLPLKRGIQTWRELWEDICAAKAKLAEAARGIINAKSKRVFNTWLEAAAEERAKKDKLKRALALMSPEGRAKKLFVQRLVWVRRRKLAMQRAASGFILSGCRLALRSMHGQLMFRRRLAAAANNIINSKARKVYNTWWERAEKAAARMRKLEAALLRMSPEGRAMGRAMGCFKELLMQRGHMQRAAHGFIYGSMRRAIGEWIAATFEAFHIMTGIDGFDKFRMRRALSCWRARSDVRRGLCRQIWMSAQRGRDLPRLRELMRTADDEDLASAIVAKDNEGATPLLWAAKKGHADVAAVLIESGTDVSAMVNTADVDGNSALHWAARKNFPEVARKLIDAGAAVNARNKEESTPLHWAARKNNVDMLQLLLGADANPRLRNKYGATASENAAAIGQRGAVDALAQHMRANPRKKAAARSPGEDDEGGAARGGDDGAADATGASHNPLPPKRKMEFKRKMANRRREAAQKAMREDQSAREREGAARQRRGEIERQLTELLRTVNAVVKSGATPPRVSSTTALATTVKHAKEAGCSAPLITEAEGVLHYVAGVRRQQRASKEGAKAPGGADARENDDLEKMQRKMGKKLGAGLPPMRNRAGGLLKTPPHVRDPTELYTDPTNTGTPRQAPV